MFLLYSLRNNVWQSVYLGFSILNPLPVIVNYSVPLRLRLFLGEIFLLMACGQSSHQREKFKGSLKENCNGREKNIYSFIVLSLAI